VFFSREKVEVVRREVDLHAPSINGKREKNKTFSLLSLTGLHSSSTSSTAEKIPSVCRLSQSESSTALTSSSVLASLRFESSRSTIGRLVLCRPLIATAATRSGVAPAAAMKSSASLSSAC